MSSRRWQKPDLAQPALPGLVERLVLEEDSNPIPLRTVARQPDPKVAEMRARLQAAISEFFAARRRGARR